MAAMSRRTQTTDVFSKNATVEDGTVVKLISSQAIQPKSSVPNKPAALKRAGVIFGSRL